MEIPTHRGGLVDISSTRPAVLPLFYQGEDATNGTGRIPIRACPGGGGQFILRLARSEAALMHTRGTK